MAINFRILDHEASMAKKDEIVKLILSRLGKDKHGDYLTVYEYLQDVLHIPEKKLTSKAVQKYRLAWVDELIREFEAEGD